MSTYRASLDIEQSYWDKGLTTLAGIDEAGRGPLAGPVVAAAVIFPAGSTIKGVEDSKKLSERHREELYPVIHEQALSVGVGIVAHDVIDRVNILQATILAMHKAIDELNIVPEFVIVDGNTFRHDRLPFANIIDGDEKSFTIAAASIIAKVTRDRLMREFHRQYPVYGFDRHKGYGTRQHLDAIKRYGPCAIHRRSFDLHDIG